METKTKIKQYLRVELRGEVFRIEATRELFERLSRIPEQFLKLQQEVNAGKLSDDEVGKEIQKTLDGILGAGAIEKTFKSKEGTINELAAAAIHVANQITKQITAM